MKIPIYQIDAFSDQPFKGNAAAVCPLEQWPEDHLLQSIAAENNLSETAFFVRKNDYFEIRWFTPYMEVDLCGHATLASAYVIFSFLDYQRKTIQFSSKSGELKVYKEDELIILDFPSRPAEKTKTHPLLIEALSVEPIEILKARDYLVVYESEEIIRSIKPDYLKLKQLDSLGIIITAKGDTADFVSRFFAPRAGIDEDPVTGSAHSTLIPYWAKKLNKNDLVAHQISHRGGKLFCTYKDKRVLIGGQACTFLKGEINV